MDTRNIDDLKANPKNPRTMSEFDMTNLKKVIKEFGDLSGIVFNTASSQLVGGHQRVTAFKQLGGQPVVEERLDAPNSVGTTARGYVLLGDEKYTYREVNWPIDSKDEEGNEYSAKEYAANVAANRISGQFDQDLLAQITFEISQANPDLLALTGQTDQEITKLLDSVTGVYGTLDDEDEAPEVEEVETEVVSKHGEIYQLGPHRLMCGDSTSDDHVGRLMAGTIAQMVFTDPPYNIGYEGGGGGKREGIMNDKMSTSKFIEFLDAVCANLHKYNDGAEYICMSSKELDTLKQSFERTGGHFQNYIIWVKDRFTLSGSDYQHKYEPIVYGWPDRTVNHYYVGARDKANVWEDLHEVNTEFDGEYTNIYVGDIQVRVLGQASGEVRRKKLDNDVWKFDRPTKSEDHPTMKPLALCEEAIRNSSLKGGTVLDLFGGSGSTLIASDRQGRVCNMMELDPKYADVIRKRYAKHIGASDWQAATPLIENLEGLVDHVEAPIEVYASIPAQPAADGYTPPSIPQE